MTNDKIAAAEKADSPHRSTEGFPPLLLSVALNADDAKALSRWCLAVVDSARAKHHAEKAEPAHSWRADVGGASVYNDDFTTDVRLNISGDFEDSAERKAYADALAAKLNAASQAEKAEPVPLVAISGLLADAMERAVGNGANSVSMPDEYVEIAAWLLAKAPKA